MVCMRHPERHDVIAACTSHMSITYKCCAESGPCYFRPMIGDQFGNFQSPMMPWQQLTSPCVLHMSWSRWFRHMGNLTSGPWSETCSGIPRARWCHGNDWHHAVCYRCGDEGGSGRRRVLLPAHDRRPAWGVPDGDDELREAHPRLLGGGCQLETHLKTSAEADEAAQSFPVSIMSLYRPFSFPFHWHQWVQHLMDVNICSWILFCETGTKIWFQYLPTWPNNVNGDEPFVSLMFKAVSAFINITNNPIKVYKAYSSPKPKHYVTRYQQQSYDKTPLNIVSIIMDSILKMMEKYSARLCCTAVVVAVCVTGQLGSWTTCWRWWRNTRHDFVVLTLLWLCV